MLYLAAVFLIIAILAAVFGAGRVEAIATKIALVLALVAVILFVLGLFTGHSVAPVLTV